MRGSPNIGGITRSLRHATRAITLLASLVGAIALLASLVGTTTGSARHAARHLAARHLAAHHFPKPTVSVDGLNSPYPTATGIIGSPDVYGPPSIDVSGQGFTPGDPLHLQLIASDGPNAGSVLAEEDITASLDTYIPQGNGQDLLVPGGEFGIKLTPSLASELLCQAMTHAVVTVVDTATGQSASSYGVDISRWGCVLGSPTPEP